MAEPTPKLNASRAEKAAFIKSVLQLRNLAKGVPSSFQFNLKDDNPRLYFIGCEEAESKNSLYYADLPVNNSGEVPTANWSPAISADSLEQKSATLSKEEELLRERKRVVSFGITSYNFHESSQKFLIPAAGSLYTIDVSKSEASVQELSTTNTGARMDSKWSDDGKFVSFIRNNNIWVQNVADGKETQLTTTKNDTESCGVAEFVMQEEFDRYTGYWWAPKVKEGDKAAYRILYFKVDESQVRLYKVSENTIEGTTEDQRYPLVGEANATSTVHMLELDANGQVIADKPLQPSLAEKFPWVEYIARAGWFPDGQSIWLQVLDRLQMKFEFIKFPLSCFGEGGLSYTLYTESTATWINVSSLIYFHPTEEWILFTGEGGGFRHIYKFHPKQQLKQLTDGKWQVDEEFLKVDTKRKLIYFMGTKDTPLEQHLYCVNYENGEIHRLTDADFSHKVTLTVSDKGTFFVSKYSNSKTPSAVAVFSVNYENGAPVVKKILQIAIRNPEHKWPFPLTVPEIFTFNNQRGIQLYGAIYKPANYDPSKKYPTILYMYGGPHVQLVVNEFDMLVVRNMKFQLYNQLGYAVVVIDSVGSARRGMFFESIIKNSMGTVELPDQIEGLKYLSETSIVDLNRICITGWSYGGYMSLMAMAQHSNFFKLAISGAPVVLWEAYDTGYTERYMTQPKCNEKGYKDGSVLTYIENFPDEENRWMVIHGLKDENVHFSHTARLIEALVDAGKPYSLYVYPKERHGVRNPNSYIHLEVKILTFLENL